MYVCVCIGDDDDVEANGSRSAQELPTGFARVNQVSSGSPAQSAVSTKCICSICNGIMAHWNM